VLEGTLGWRRQDEPRLLRYERETLLGCPELPLLLLLDCAFPMLESRRLMLPNIVKMREWIL